MISDAALFDSGVRPAENCAPSAQHCHRGSGSENLYEEISQTIASTATPTMEAFKLQKKYPEVSRDEMFDLINRFKYVFIPLVF